MAGIVAPIPAIPAPRPTTFAALYADHSSDPYDGDYAAVMRNFRDRGAALSHNVMHDLAAGVAITTPNAYIGMYEYPGEECGRSMVLHSVARFPRVIGRPTPWDARTYAYIQDVVDGEIVSVALPSVQFERTNGILYTNVPGTDARMTELWAHEPDVELLGPFAEDDANVRQSRTRRLMYVPPRFLPIVINRRLSPRELWVDLVGAIEAEGMTDSCRELVDWVKLTGVRHDAALPSHVCQATPAVPLADANFIRHRKTILLQQLPGLVPAPAGAGSDAHVAQMANFVGQLVNESRISREEARDRQDETRAPKLPSSHWGEAACQLLCLLCGVTTEADLPEVWLALAAAGKKDRLAIEAVLLAIAAADDCIDQAAIITPDLAKKLSSLQFAGSNMDDLTEGIQPFALMLQDHSTEESEATSAHARRSAEDYDQLMGGGATTDLSDIRSLRETSKVTIPQTYHQAKASFQAMDLLLKMLLGSYHPTYVAYHRFLRGYTNREVFYANRLTRLDLNHGPALFVRHNQLLLVNWFRQMRTHRTLPPLPAPDFHAVLGMLDLSLSSWIPSLPLKYMPKHMATAILPSSRPTPATPGRPYAPPIGWRCGGKGAQRSSDQPGAE